MNLIQLNVTRDALRKELTALDAIKPACTNCLNYSHPVCKLAQEAPPAQWVAGPVECESWEYDEIPF